MSILRGLFGRTKRSKVLDFQNKLAFLEVDMHNHILPAIDDGADTLEHSYLLIRGLQTLGIHKFICTPHIDKYTDQTVLTKIDEAYHRLQDYVQQQESEVIFTYGAEYLVNKAFNQYLEQPSLRALPGGYVLIEQSYKKESKHLFGVIERIQQLGFKPVLAHPERYAYYHGDFDVFSKIKDAGCLLQLNILSVSSYYGVSVKRTGAHLMKKGMYDFVGTDVHHERHILALQEVLNRYDMADLLRSCNILNPSLQDYLS